MQTLHTVGLLWGLTSHFVTLEYSLELPTWMPSYFYQKQQF